MRGRNRFVLCVLLCLSGIPFSAAQTYRVIDLGTLGGYYSAGTAINFFGQVAGYSDIADHSAVHAFLWTKGKGMQDLNPPGIAQSLALAINDFGDVVGVAVTAGDHPTSHAFLWTKANGMQDLGNLGGPSTASGINDFGQVAGDSGTVQGGDDGFLWSSTRGMRDLGTLNGGISVALALNNFSQVVGGSSAADGFHAFLWTKWAGMRDLGTLGGCESDAAGINDLGHVVGGSINAGCDPTTRHAFLWKKETGMQDLGTPPGTSFGGPGAINVFGQVVGAACPVQCLSQESVHAFLWSEHTGWLDLNNLIPADSGWVLENTQAISALGQITGQGFINGQYHAFVLRPKRESRR
jgi:probable HAF family extracellular repeat protein